MRPLLVVTLMLVGSVAFAQSERYELGARLKAFEAEWDKQTDKDARKRAVKLLPDVTSQFFTFQYGKAAQTLDAARFALQGDKPPSDAVLWATSLYPEVKTRLVGGDEIEVSVKQFYKTDTKRPDKVSVQLRINEEKWVPADVEKLPAKITLPLPLVRVSEVILRRRNEFDLTMEVTLDNKPLATRKMTVSAFDGVSADRFPHLDSYAKYYEEVGGLSPLEAASWNDRVELLKGLAGGTIPESDVPASLRIAEMGSMLARRDKSKDYFTTDNPGDHWLTVPTGKDGKTITPCRLFVPEKLDAKKPVPLVVAMHGAGGSENLFFEGYGNGHVVKLCKERGWLLVSPRAGLGFGLTPAPPVGDIIDELAKRYPVDAKRVFVVGHSMGSSMALDVVQKHPGKFAAAACLGGGGKVRDEKAFDGLPVFVGVGDQDFAVKTAKALHAALEKTKAKVTFKEYADVEHLLIVREALGDVFDLFDKVK